MVPISLLTYIIDIKRVFSFISFLTLSGLIIPFKSGLIYEVSMPFFLSFSNNISPSSIFQNNKHCSGLIPQYFSFKLNLCHFNYILSSNFSKFFFYFFQKRFVVVVFYKIVISQLNNFCG